MKVAYFLGGLNRGGTESLMLDICRRKNEASYDMIVVYRNLGELYQDFCETGVPMVRIKPEKGRYLSYLCQLRRLMQREHVDIVHAQTLLNGLLAVFFLLFTRIKLVTTFHGLFFGWIKKMFYHIVMWGSDATLYVSDYVRGWYAHRSWCNHKKFHTVYNGIDFSKIDAAEPSSEFVDEPHRIRLAMVGNFVSARTQQIIVKSIYVLRERGIRDYEFYFIGRRDKKEAWRYDECVRFCKEHHLDNVHFLGSRGDVLSLLKVMDGFVYSTDHDTFGIAIVEAMAVGLPIVVNDWPVMKEICGRNENAVRFFITGDEKDCARHMSVLISNIPQCKQTAEEGVNEVRNRFSISQHIIELDKIYKSIYV